MLIKGILQAASYLFVANAALSSTLITEVDLNDESRVSIVELRDFANVTFIDPLPQEGKINIYSGPLLLLRLQYDVDDFVIRSGDRHTLTFSSSPQFVVLNSGTTSNGNDIFFDLAVETDAPIRFGANGIQRFSGFSDDGSGFDIERQFVNGFRSNGPAALSIGVGVIGGSQIYETREPPFVGFGNPERDYVVDTFASELLFFSLPDSHVDYFTVRSVYMTFIVDAIGFGSILGQAAFQASSPKTFVQTVPLIANVPLPASGIMLLSALFFASLLQLTVVRGDMKLKGIEDTDAVNV